jgi:hypothetical protein
VSLNSSSHPRRFPPILSGEQTCVEVRLSLSFFPQAPPPNSAHSTHGFWTSKEGLGANGRSYPATTVSLHVSNDLLSVRQTHPIAYPSLLPSCSPTQICTRTRKRARAYTHTHTHTHTEASIYHLKFAHSERKHYKTGTSNAMHSVNTTHGQAWNTSKMMSSSSFAWFIS